MPPILKSQYSPKGAFPIYSIIFLIRTLNFPVYSGFSVIFVVIYKCFSFRFSCIYYIILKPFDILNKKTKGETSMARHGENIRKRKDGRWEARLICGYKENGRAKYKYIYRKTYAEAKEAKNQMMAQNFFYGTRKTAPCQTRRSFGSLLTDWLHFIQPDVKESTYTSRTGPDFFV